MKTNSLVFRYAYTEKGELIEKTCDVVIPTKAMYASKSDPTSGSKYWWTTENLSEQSYMVAGEC